MIKMWRSVVSWAVISTCFFIHISCEHRPNINNRRTDKVPLSSADIIMKEDAEEIFYNLDVNKYEDESAKCSPVHVPENGYLVGEGTRVGTVLYIKCHEGFWLSGTAVMACTSEDGTPKWTPYAERRCIKGRTFFNEDGGKEAEDDETELPKENKENEMDFENPIPPFVGHRWMPDIHQTDEQTKELKSDKRLKQEIEDRMPSRCLAKPDPGSCDATHKRFYFDTEKMECNKFYYGGCAGNANRFESMEDCMSVCKGHSVLSSRRNDD